MTGSPSPGKSYALITTTWPAYGPKRCGGNSTGHDLARSVLVYNNTSRPRVVYSNGTIIETQRSIYCGLCIRRLNRPTTRNAALPQLVCICSSMESTLSTLAVPHLVSHVCVMNAVYQSQDGEEENHGKEGRYRRPPTKISFYVGEE